ncbi:hypothetical protein BB558_001094 [Smittium angustum]|uniref:Vps41 beta-propeller domain-containing protein n=1 Tax=Smittium angustum TaxID=133377 RepID=A0A2U1JCC8_SMIAN|nr:hypothetical protein BB558_003746 [Smittium angustum]PWA02757.1 hypothetical protein BB558_001094 [Smittium angustum]
MESKDTDPKCLSSEDEYEEYEPFFDYKRIRGDLDEIFINDSASISILTEKFLVLGTHWGSIYVLDLKGNIAKKWNSHRAAVTSVSVDIHNEYVLSGSDDGKVVIHELFTNERKIIADHQRPVKAVAIEPLYNKLDGKIVSGGALGQLIVHEERRWPLGKRDVVLDEDKGTIRLIKWNQNIIAVSNEQGIMLYEMQEMIPLTKIDRVSYNINTDLIPCRMRWEDEKTLLIACGNHLQTIEIVQIHRNSTEQKNKDQKITKNIYAKILSTIESDGVIVGAARNKDDRLLLIYPEEVDTEHQQTTSTDSISEQSIINGPSNSQEIKEFNSDENKEICKELDHKKEYTKEFGSHSSKVSLPPPELRVINENFEEESNDVLELPGYEKYNANNYDLILQPNSSVSGEKIWYVISPKQITEVRQKSFKQHISWLTDRSKYKEAYESIIKTVINKEGRFGNLNENLPGETIIEVGLGYSEGLLARKKYSEACESLAFILSNVNNLSNSDQFFEIGPIWEKWAFKFAAFGKLGILVDFIPTNVVGISQTVYEMILADLLNFNVERFCEITQVWPVELYNTKSVELATIDKITKLESAEDDMSHASANSLRLALANILDRAGFIEQALKHFLILHHPGIIERINRENLAPLVRNRAYLLLEYDNYYIKHNHKEHSNYLSDGGSEANKENILDLGLCGEGINLLISNIVSIPPSHVIPQLLKWPIYMHLYLHLLRLRDPDAGGQFADMQDFCGVVNITHWVKRVGYVNLED